MSVSSSERLQEATTDQPRYPQRLARIAGAFFVITFVTSIGAVILYDPVLHHADYILGAGEDARIYMGAFLEILLIIANIGTAVTLFPILKRRSESIGLGYIASRVVESTIIAIGIVSLLSVVTLRGHYAEASSTDAATLDAVGRSARDGQAVRPTRVETPALAPAAAAS